MTNPELQTIRDYIRFATSQFNEAGLSYGHGTNNAWDEAVSLVLHTLHIPYDLYANVLDAKLTTEEKNKLADLISKRVIDRIPLPYLTHEAWFANLPFYVDERVLIPRSSIGELIQNHFSPWIVPERINHILDLCTGSGCIAIACAKYFPQAQIDASDIAKEALAVAKINLVKHEVEDQINLVESDLFEKLPQKKYDLIISNPPYVDAEDMGTLPKEYTHEPQLALAAGLDGLECVLKILKNSADYLHPEGLLIVEVGNSETALMNQFPNLPFTWLEFEHSEGGVFLLNKNDLIKFRNYF